LRLKPAVLVDAAIALLGSSRQTLCIEQYRVGLGASDRSASKTIRFGTRFALKRHRHAAGVGGFAAFAVGDAAFAKFAAETRSGRAGVGGGVTRIGSARGFVFYGACDAGAFVTNSFARDVTAVGVYLARRAGVVGAFRRGRARAVGVCGAFDAFVVDAKQACGVAVAVVFFYALDAFVLFVGRTGFAEGRFAAAPLVIGGVAGDAFVVDAEVCSAVRGVEAFDAGVGLGGSAWFAVRYRGITTGVVFA
jgi:hypothetical protein